MQIIPLGVICYFPTKVSSTVVLHDCKAITHVRISTLQKNSSSGAAIPSSQPLQTGSALEWLLKHSWNPLEIIL